MATPVDRERVRRLMDAGAQIVEVLAADDYGRLHLPGAINIPLKDLDGRTAARLRRDAPIVTYCHDFQ
jgi:rhodanese-related sulfurtransferase